MPYGRKWTDEQLELAFKASKSIAEILVKLGLSPTGANYKSIRKHLFRLSLDPNKLAGQSWRKGHTRPVYKRSLDDILVKESTYSTQHLRKRLISEGVFEYICVMCGGTEWLGQPIPLELDHINGVNTDNRIENLRLLCPNCHAFTPTYRGKKNKGL